MEFHRGAKCVKTTSVSIVKLGVDIPEWLLVEVLLRLPVKQVFRAKLVSKQWLSVISDPSFVRMYVSRNSASPQFQIWTFLSDRNIDGEYLRLEDVYSQDLKSPNLLALPCPINDNPSVTNYKICGVNNGLVLYAPAPSPYFNAIHCSICKIYNPITGQWISLPPYTRHFLCACCFVTRVENGVLSSYRVVRLHKSSEASNIIRFEVFVSETNEWKDFDVCIDQAVKFIWQNPTALNGILHWKTRGHGIIAYDPYHNPESLRFIALPHEADPKKDKRRTSLCDARQGSLRYFEVFGVRKQPHGFSNFGVWILNDYNTEDWSLQHKIYSDEVLYDDFLFGKRLCLAPISFHPFDPHIVYMGYRNIIISYNIKTRKLEAHGGPHKRPCWLRVFTFAVPPWPTAVNHPS